MTNYRFRLPSMGALSAFESAARNCSFSRASEELNTSQPAVSRHIAGLEAQLGTKLFDRQRNRVALTADGRRLYHAVVAGLHEIGRAVDELKGQPRHSQLSIACSYDVAHLWLMPRHDALQRALGPETDIRIVVSEYEHQEVLRDEAVDLALTFLNPLPEGSETVRIFDEEVVPVAAPGLPDAAPLLHLSKRNFGWARWEDWYLASGEALPEGRPERRFSSYVYLLEAAADGAGLALGWTGLVDRYIEQGRLRPMAENGMKTGGAFHAMVSRGNGNGRLIDAALGYLCP